MLNDYITHAPKLTKIAISEDVSIPDPSPKETWQQAVVQAVLRAKNPNLLEVCVAGGNHLRELEVLCDTNRRTATHLLEKARDANYALQPQDYMGIMKRLPAMIAIASNHGANQSEHSMSNEDVVAMLTRIEAASIPEALKSAVQELKERFTSVPAPAPTPAPAPVAAAPAAQVMAGGASTEGQLVALMEQGAFPPIGG